MDKIKTFTVLVLTGLLSWMGDLGILVLILVFVSLIDYGTGCMAAKYRGEALSSAKSLKGIIKKLCLWLLVVVGGVMDWLLLYTGSAMGVELPAKFVISTLVAMWLVCNELLSILENIADTDANIPPFLLPLLNRIKLETEGKVRAEKEEAKR